MGLFWKSKPAATPPQKVVWDLIYVSVYEYLNALGHTRSFVDLHRTRLSALAHDLCKQEGRVMRWSMVTGRDAKNNTAYTASVTLFPVVVLDKAYTDLMTAKQEPEATPAPAIQVG